MTLGKGIAGHSWYLVPVSYSKAHSIPLNDLREHLLSSRCWCKPTEDDELPGSFLHHSLDGRERYEVGERHLS